MGKHAYTRGSGLLEVLLTKKRAAKANSIIPLSYRKGKILDIGCGWFPYFLTHTNFNEKYGIDPSLDLKSVKNKKINLSTQDVTAKKLPFQKDYFNVVTMLAVFEHIDYDRLDFVLFETKRVLKKGGILIITTPAPWSDKLLHFMAIFGLISKEEIHEHKHHYDKASIEKTLIKTGFQKSKIKSGYFEMGLNMWFTGKK